MNHDNFYLLEYLDCWPHFYCYSHNVSTDMSFGILQVFHVEFGCLNTTSNWTLYSNHWDHQHHLTLSAPISLTLSRHPPYRPLLPVGPQGYIPYRHRAAVCRFELVVLPLYVHVKWSTRVHHLWALPYFSSSTVLILLIMSKYTW